MERFGDAVLEGRGRAALLGAQAANCGDAMPSRICILWVFEGGVAAVTEGTKIRMSSVNKSQLIYEANFCNIKGLDTNTTL